MLEHPGIELQVLIKEKGLTQKAFASILGKKVSEVNELLKGKRNITIQRDYLLHQTLGTPVKYWILKQVDYDYSLIDIDETQHQNVILSNSEESSETGHLIDSSAHKGAPKGQTDSQEIQTKLQETPIQKSDSKDDKDLQNRANIFRSF